MIRRPTPREIAYDWHTRTLAGEEITAITDQPEPGWYKRKLVKGGPFVPARIWLRQEVDEAGELLDDEILLCEVNGTPRDPYDEWNWLCANPISEEDYDHMRDLKQWAAYHSPNDPSVNARKPVDWATIAPPKF